MPHVSIMRNDNNNAVYADSYKNHSNEEESLLNPYDILMVAESYSNISPLYNWEFFCNELEYE